MLVFGVLSAPWPAKTPLYYRVLPFSNPCKKGSSTGRNWFGSNCFSGFMNIPVGKNGFVHASKKKERNEAKLQRRWRFPPSIRTILLYHIHTYRSYIILHVQYMYWYLYVLTLIYIHTHIIIHHISYIIQHHTTYIIHHHTWYIILIFICTDTYIHTYIIIHHLSHIIHHT